MKRFFSRLVRFFWSLGFLIFVLSVFALIVLLYAEEDWRGARELAAAKARWTAEGYSLTPADYYPPPVPDEQNLAALPIFQLKPDPKQSGRPWDGKLHEATDEEAHGGSLTGYDLKVKLSNLVAAAYAKLFPGKIPPASRVAQLEELYPIIAELRAAAPARPLFRINQDYAYQPVWERPLGLVIDQIKVAKLLSHHAELALDEKQSQIALDDIELGFQIASGAAREPSIVGGLVAIGVTAITRTNLVEGLKTHVWSDTQLAQLQEALKRLDCLELYQLDMRAECAISALPLTQALRTKPSLVNLVLESVDDAGAGPSAEALLASRIWANGWWDINAAQMADFYRRESGCVDTTGRKIDLKLHGQILADLEKTKEMLGGAAPWNILYLISTEPLTQYARKFAQGQVQVDEDRIVCGLERYRLTHGAYPPSLEALVPACIDEVPRDIINGGLYRYRLNADGTFVLYSVGWNQVDDGGKIAYRDGGSIDYTQGDWVWPMVKK